MSSLKFVMTQDVACNNTMNPLEPHQTLQSPSHALNVDKEAHPQQDILAGDSTVTKAEKIERHGEPDDDLHESPTKRIKVNSLDIPGAETNGLTRSERRKGVAPIKAELGLRISTFEVLAHSVQILGLPTRHRSG